ncbi:MAG: diacylglycerol kinase family lipid kinase [Verrucomicrobia bacterium]|nr:diacylglycerol kinase family lipid kinase [Verrucomicrobiota bacterium]
MAGTCVIFNPVACGERAQARLRRLREMAGGAAFLPTAKAGHAMELAEQVARDGCGTVVAAGGDGTINEVVNGLMRVPSETRPRLGVAPLGTANVYARELGLPLSMGGAWRVIAAGRERRVDVGVARGAGGEQRYFAALAGAGFDALAIAALDLRLKKRINWLAYVISGFRIVARGLPRLTVTADGRRCEGCFVFIGNGRLYGGSYRMFPKARLDDGMLEVCVFEGGRVADVLRYLPRVLAASHPKLADVHYLRAKQVRVESPQPAPTELDGELWKDCPVEFSIEPGALRVLAP